jgi:hypothetical protein
MANEIRGPKAGLAAAAIMCVLWCLAHEYANLAPNSIPAGLFSLLTLCVPLLVATTTNLLPVRTPLTRPNRIAS